MSVQRLSALYEGLLTSTGLEVDLDKKVQSPASVPGKFMPVQVDKRVLFIPNDVTLRTLTAPDVKDLYIAFHPLSESILRTQSPVIKWFRQVCMIRLQAVINELMLAIIEIAADHGRHAGLHPKALEFLSCLTDADENMVSTLANVMLKVDGDKNRLINIYLKQGGKFDGKAVHRSANVTFPILEELDNESGVLFGVKLRKKDRVTIKKFFLALLPGSDDPLTYSYGSSSSTAPYFHALINAYVKVASRLNSVTKVFAKNLDSADGLHINLDWSGDLIDNIAEFRETIPPLSGNEGETKDEVKTVAQAPMAPTAFSAPAPVVNQQVAVAPALPTLPMAGLPTLNSVQSEYKPITGFGISAEAAKTNPSVNQVAKDNDGGDLEMLVVARNSGFGYNAATRQIQMSTNFPWLANYNPNAPQPGMPAMPMMNMNMGMPMMNTGMPVYPQQGFAVAQPAPQMQFGNTVSSI